MPFHVSPPEHGSPQRFGRSNESTVPEEGQAVKCCSDITAAGARIAATQRPWRTATPAT
jgi:hypothetical protein